MKTTLDLPPNLVRAMKVRAARDGRKLKEVVAEVVRAGLAMPIDSSPRRGPKVNKDKKTGLPVIQCRHAAKPDEEMTPERVAELLAAQEGDRPMILGDTNLWLALALSKHAFHQVVRDWFDRQSKQSVVFCRSTQQSLLRLLTTQAVVRPYGIPAMTNAEAWKFYHDLRSDRRCGFVNEPRKIEPWWKSFANRTAASPKLWMDAYLAAFAVAARYQMATTDEGFKQFDGLQLVLLSPLDDAIEQ